MDGGGRGRYGGGHYGGGGGGGGGRHRGGGRRGGGRGGRFRHQPYNNRSRGRGGGGGRGNRFGGQNSYQDPQTVMLRQVSSFVSRVGEFKNIREQSPDTPEIRAVVSTAAANINDLTAVLCSEDKLELLLKYPKEQPSAEMMEGSSSITDSSNSSSKPEEKVGNLVHIVISCAAALPLQTPCYAALTVAVHAQVQGGPWEGFASRCVQYAMVHIARDLDTILLMGKGGAQAVCRVKLLLRYLAVLGKIGVVKAYYDEGGDEAIDPSKMTVVGLLSLLVAAANAASEPHNNPTAANILSILVLSTLPYVMEYVPPDVMSEKFVKPLEAILGTYKSTFSPGVGMSAILLKEAQLEDEDDDDDDQEDDEEGEDEEEPSGQVCDNLQDLLRTAQRLGKKGEATRFALPMDQPWKGLSRKSTPNPEEGGETESHPISYDGEPLHLSFSQECQAITLLMGGDSPFKLQCFSLEGAVFGRLPIFGSPPDPDDEDDEEEMEGATKNEHLDAFKGLSLLDRYFVAETMRDCLISHESHVNATGLQHGSAKTAAEEMLTVCHVLSGDNPSAGCEYAILETILGLIAQSTNYGSLRHIFLSRVILELTRLEPSRFSPALLVGVTNLFQDYLPALVPTARDNFSRWFSFHLINTDYQWPSAYWKLWEPYATSSKPSSRGSFVRRVLNLMAENVADPSLISTQCFSETKSLAGELLGRPSSTSPDESPVESLESEIHRRLWDNDEEPTVLSDFLLGDEVAASLREGSWGRTDVLTRVIMDPAKLMCEGLKSALEKSDDEDQMADDDTISKDVFATISDSITRYKETLLGAITKDAGSLEGSSSDDLSVVGGAFLLRRVQSVASFSANLLEGIVSCLLKNRVVSDLAVLHWLLGDIGGGVAADVVPLWWRLATDAAQESLVCLENDSSSGGTMAVDGGGMDSDAEFSTKAVTQLSQMLQYAVKRVCSLLGSAGQNADDKRLSPQQVDLLEGVKTFAMNSRIGLDSMLTRPAGMRQACMPNEVQELFGKSEINGSSLAGLCSGYEGVNSVSLLQRSLEKL